jgi:hypothetical protein
LCKLLDHTKHDLEKVHDKQLFLKPSEKSRGQRFLISPFSFPKIAENARKSAKKSQKSIFFTVGARPHYQFFKKTLKSTKKFLKKPKCNTKLQKSAIFDITISFQKIACKDPKILGKKTKIAKKVHFLP